MLGDSQGNCTDHGAQDEHRCI